MVIINKNQSFNIRILKCLYGLQELETGSECKKGTIRMDQLHGDMPRGIKHIELVDMLWWFEEFPHRFSILEYTFGCRLQLHVTEPMIQLLHMNYRLRPTEYISSRLIIDVKDKPPNDLALYVKDLS